jgi:hypothetical protein
MSKYYITFGQKYRTEPHPILGICCADGYVVVKAEDMKQARDFVFTTFGTAWSNIYAENYDFAMPINELFPMGEIGFLPA